MKRILSGMCCLLFIVSLALPAHLLGSDAKPITGQDYRGLSDTVRWMFAGGFYMGFGRGHFRGTAQALDQIHHELIAQGFKDVGPEQPITLPQNPLYNCLSSLTIGQAGAILDKYVAEHPERWDKQIGDLAEEAFNDACAKRAKNP